MARPKLQVTKSVYIRFRVEPIIKKKFEDLCKKNKTSSANRMREILNEELKKH